MTSSRLLVVDDDPDVRDSLSRALRYAGYQVITAVHGGDALDAVARSPVDLIVLDVLMPIMDGFEACRRLRERGDATPVLVLTARDAVDDRVPGLTPARTTTWSSRSRWASCRPGSGPCCGAPRPGGTCSATPT